MPFLPVVDRELRVAARRDSTFQIRLATATVGLFLTLWIWLGELVQNTPASGPRLLSLLAYAAFALSLATGPLFTADLISREKREGTLGLLFLTRLQPAEVILGKLAGATLRPAYALLAFLPILSLPLLLGGVTLATTLQTVAVLANTLLLSATSGLLISTTCRNERLATALTTITVLALNLTPLADHWLQPLSSTPLFFSHFSPSFALYLALQPSVIAPDPGLPQLVWTTQHSLAWILLALACLLVPRFLHDPPVLPHQAAPWPQRLAQTLDRYLRPSPPPLARNHHAPYARLAARGHLHPLLLWSALATTALLGLAGLATLRSSATLNALALAAATLLLHGLVKTWMIAESVHRLAQDRLLGTLELLLGSRLTPAEIVLTLRAHLRQRIVPPTTAVLLSTPLLAALLAYQPQTSFGQTHLLSWFLVSLLVLLADLWTLETVGPWVGLSSRHPHHALLRAAWQILVVPWLTFLALLLLFGLDWRHGLSLAHAWLIICILNNLVWWTRAAAGLQHHYHYLATERSPVPFSPRLPPPPDPPASYGLAALANP